MTPRRERLRASLAVAAASLLLYLPVLRHGIVARWDDGSVLETAGWLSRLGWEQVRWALTSFELSTWQPLGWLVYAVLARLGGGSHAVYHGFSALLHAVACGAFYFLAHALLARSYPERRARLLAGLAGLVFAWHPLMVESVAAAASIGDLLSTTLVLVAAALYEEGEGEGRFYRYALAAFAAACLGRWQAATLPVGLAALDYCSGRGLSLRRLLPFLGLSAAVVGVYAGVKSRTMGMGSAAFDPGAAGAGLWLYAAKWVWPSGLMPVYRLDELSSPPALAAALAAAAALAKWGRRGPLAAAAVYAAVLAPTFVPASAGAVYGHDRYAYLACAGLPIAAAWLVGKLWSARSPRAPAAAALAAGLLALGFGRSAAARLDDWKDGQTFWRAVLRERPEFPLGLASLGEELLDAGRDYEGLDVYKRQARIDPVNGRLNLGFAYTNVGIELAQRGKLEESRAAFRAALANNPSLEKPREYLGRVEKALAARRTARARR